MSADREMTRIVRSWLQTDEHESADRVLDAVFGRLDTTPQRRPKWRAWRDSLMSSSLKFAAAGLAVVVVAGITGAIFFSRPALSPAASPSAVPSLAQSPAPTQAVQMPSSLAPSVSSLPPSTPVTSKAGWIVFLSRPEGGGTGTPNDLWAIRADGTDAHVIFPELNLPSIAWSRDGTNLLANTEDVNGVSHVLAAEVSDDIGPFVDTGFSTGADTACHGKSGRDFPCQSSAFSFAPDGQRVLFMQSCTWSVPGCGFLSILDLRNGELTELAATVERGRFPMALPAWSPDGTRIAYVRETDNHVIGESGGVPTSNLYVIDADGENLRQIDIGGLSATAPNWSPDSSTIAFSTIDWGTDENLDQDVYIVTADGSSQPRRLTRDGMSSWPEWTGPDEIRFRRGDAQGAATEFWVMTSHGGDQIKLLDLGATLGQLDPPVAPSNLFVPGDPGTTFWWQPTD